MGMKEAAEFLYKTMISDDIFGCAAHLKQHGIKVKDTFPPTHVLEEDYQFPGDYKFPKGSFLYVKDKVTFVTEKGRILGAKTGEPLKLYDTLALYDKSPDLKIRPL